jgi:hypothetical protein
LAADLQINVKEGEFMETEHESGSSRRDSRGNGKNPVNPRTVREVAGTRKHGAKKRKASPGKEMQRVQGTRDVPETGPSFQVPEDRMSRENFGEAKDLGDLRTSDVGTLDAGVGEKLTATIDELDPADAQDLREQIKDGPTGFGQALRNDIRRFQGIRSAGRDAFRELKTGFISAYSEIRSGFVRARHEFSVGLDRAISKVLS